MTSEPNSAPGHGSADAEILRLRQQLAAREEVIHQLNRQIVEQADGGQVEEFEPDQDVLAEAVANGRALETELHRLRQVIAGHEAEITALRNQLRELDRLGLSTAMGGVRRARGFLRRLSSR